MTRRVLTIPPMALGLLIGLGQPSPGDEAPAPTPPEGFKSVFNGRDLTGWEGSPSYWSVEDGCLTGKSDGIYSGLLARPRRAEDLVRPTNLPHPILFNLF